MLWYSWFLIHFMLVWRFPDRVFWIFSISGVLNIIIGKWIPDLRSISELGTSWNPTTGSYFLEEHVYVLIVFALACALGYGLYHFQLLMSLDFVEFSPFNFPRRPLHPRQTLLPVDTLTPISPANPVIVQSTNRLMYNCCYSICPHDSISSCLLGNRRWTSLFLSIMKELVPLIPIVLFILVFELISSFSNSSWPILLSEGFLLTFGFYLSFRIDQSFSGHSWSHYPFALRWPSSSLIEMIHFHCWLVHLIYFCILHILPIVGSKYFPNHSQDMITMKSWTMGTFLVTSLLGFLFISCCIIGYRRYRYAIQEKPHMDLSMAGKTSVDASKLSDSEQFSLPSTFPYYPPSHSHPYSNVDDLYGSNIHDDSKNPDRRSYPPIQQFHSTSSHPQPPYYHYYHHGERNSLTRSSFSSPPNQSLHELSSFPGFPHPIPKSDVPKQQQQQQRQRQSSSVFDSSSLAHVNPQYDSQSTDVDYHSSFISKSNFEGQETPWSSTYGTRPPSISSDSTSTELGVRYRQNFLTIGEMHNYIQSGLMTGSTTTATYIHPSSGQSSVPTNSARSRVQGLFISQKPASFFQGLHS